MSSFATAIDKLERHNLLDSLPKDRGDPLWTEICEACSLTHDEISALKNAVCSSQGL